MMVNNHNDNGLTTVNNPNDEYTMLLSQYEFAARDSGSPMIQRMYQSIRWLVGEARMYRDRIDVVDDHALLQLSINDNTVTCPNCSDAVPIGGLPHISFQDLCLCR